MSSVAITAASRFAQRTASPQFMAQQVRTATKKAGGSSGNGRDSAGRRLGIKLFPGLEAKAGSIIIRQRGNLFRAGENVGRGKDHTLFALKPGKVHFTRLETNKKRNVVHVV
mmetsp:Transcript_6244/g.10340  ORF Transcript_6244/g.10340 Transcript_6244/m.10340 type:complete len:112 (-) Transcript_6244:108-443(-)|eukprot:CAMPEP_0119003314 /NCGR_PEP_ID=MMETSP1176-20130426/491_1 /TAXON_ID=265551 /ORGANISM="Synedropsis recta cf, Strain CCMP1620" /LENGTH=111 /DNA_ID=CAMNT_0006954903 /DNA_START=85 /DNA_END=420 /DNA_ORIENTATION=-